MVVFSCLMSTLSPGVIFTSLLLCFLSYTSFLVFFFSSSFSLASFLMVFSTPLLMLGILVLAALSMIISLGVRPVLGCGVFL